MSRPIAWRALLLFAGVHLFAVAGVVALGLSWRGIALAGALYVARMFALMAGVHRGLAHHAYDTSRWLRFVLASVATSAGQLGPLWWASIHRLHHARSDRDEDPHDARNGFVWAHAGWFLVHTYDEVQWQWIPDLANERELRWLDRHYLAPVAALVFTLALVGGWWAVTWGFAVSTVLLWHATSLLTSLSHRIGTRRFRTQDDSKNHPAIALVTLGEGWHNNHHRYPRSARLGHAWWELDLSYLGLRMLAALGLVWNLRAMPCTAVSEDVEACPANSLA
jgi:stearoyl-CoA desaturase (delta-9 desaturase)